MKFVLHNLCCCTQQAAMMFFVDQLFDVIHRILDGLRLLKKITAADRDVTSRCSQSADQRIPSNLIQPASKATLLGSRCQSGMAFATDTMTR